MTGTPDPHEINAMKSLWLSVIRLAVEEYVLYREVISQQRKEPKNSNQRMEDLREAYSWIENAGPDFVEVCDRAGVDPVRVQRAARTITYSEIKFPGKKPRQEKPKRPRGRPRIDALT